MLQHRPQHKFGELLVLEDKGTMVWRLVEDAGEQVDQAGSVQLITLVVL